MKLFLDDERSPADVYNYSRSDQIYLEEWTIVRNYDEFVSVIQNHFDEITVISYDHDLADEHYNYANADTETICNFYESDHKEKTGFECAQWLIDFLLDNDKELPRTLIHTRNICGGQNICGLFLSFVNFRKKNPIENKQ